MKKITLICLFFFSYGTVISQSAITVFTIGDSTMANKSLNGTERGWGMLFPLFIDQDSVQVSNYGKDGRSTTSFISEGWWSQVLEQLQTGDYVIIQFGHNDEKLSSDPDVEFKANLTKFINETRNKGAIPVLLTSIVRRLFDAEGNIVDTHGAYSNATREIAQRLNVPLIDMELKTRLLENVAGWNGTREIFQYEAPNEIDNTHLVNFGAYITARLVAEGIKEQNITIPLNPNPTSLANASNSSLGLAYDYFYDNIQLANATLAGLSSASGYDDFSEVIATAQSDYDNQIFISLEEVNAATLILRQAELICRWTQSAPNDATFAIANPSFEEGTGYSSKYCVHIPLGWEFEATLVDGDVQPKNTNASDGNYRYYIWVTEGSSINFYQDIVLDSGDYTLSTDLKPYGECSSSIYVQVADSSTITKTTDGTWSSWTTFTNSFTVPSDKTTVRIGVSSSLAIMIDNFHLTRRKSGTGL